MGDVASSFDYGLNAAATEYDGQNKYLRITDIDDETHEFSKSDLTTPLADLAMSADYLLKEGDLLFARTGASVGKTYLYRQFDGMVYFAGFLIRARIGEGADPEFAYQATLTDAYKKYVAITSQRSGQPGCLCSISCCGFSHDDFSGLGRACRPRYGLRWMGLVSKQERTGKDYDQHANSQDTP